MAEHFYIQSRHNKGMFHYVIGPPDGRPIEVDVKPSEFVRIVAYLSQVLSSHGDGGEIKLDALTIKSTAEPDSTTKLSINTFDEGYEVTLNRPSLTRLVDYQETMLASYAEGIYEGHEPMPEGYPEGYPEPHRPSDETRLAVQWAFEENPEDPDGIWSTLRLPGRPLLVFRLGKNEIADFLAYNHAAADHRPIDQPQFDVLWYKVEYAPEDDAFAVSILPAKFDDPSQWNREVAVQLRPNAAGFAGILDMFEHELKPYC